MTNKAEDRALKPGTTLHGALSSYRIERTIGSGGFGITYLASSQLRIGGMQVKAMFAVKEHFPKEFCEREASGSLTCMATNRRRVDGTLRDFISEARRLKKVAEVAPDANVVKVREVFEANSTAYYVMEYLDGPTLAEHVKSLGRLSFVEAVSLLKPVIDAVALLHANRLTHLDIKPANILLARDMQGALKPTLIDFGLSKHYDEEGNATSTINTLGCSPGYSPMEQYAGLRRFSPQSDVYALAATLMFMLTGRTPLPADEITPEHITAELSGLVTPKILAAMQYALAYRRVDRTPSAIAFSQELGLGATTVYPTFDDDTVDLEDDTVDLEDTQEEYPRPKPTPSPAPKPAPAHAPAIALNPARPHKNWLWAWIPLLLLCFLEFTYTELFPYYITVFASVLICLTGIVRCAADEHNIRNYASSCVAIVAFGMFLSAMASGGSVVRGETVWRMTANPKFFVIIYLTWAVALYSVATCLTTKPMRVFLPGMACSFILYMILIKMVSEDHFYTGVGPFVIFVFTLLYSVIGWLFDKYVGKNVKNVMLAWTAFIGMVLFYIQ